MTPDETIRWEVPGTLASKNLSYFQMPPAWIGPTPNATELANPKKGLDIVVCDRTFSVGVRICAHRDGVFQFDFRGWPEGCPIDIPSYTAERNKPVPPHITALQAKAAQHRHKCAVVMNAHLACMSTALSKVQRHGVWIRQVITPSSYFTTDWVNGVRQLRGVVATYDPVLAYVAANVGFQQDICKERTRVPIHIETVKYSFDLLESILTSPLADLLLMTQLLYVAAVNYAQHDFPTALTLAWTVCEKLLRIRWDAYIEEKSYASTGTDQRTKLINSDRRKTLAGLDYTASVMSEVLALAGKLNHETYLRLTKARRGRNGWLHDFTPISDRTAAECVQTAQTFLQEASGVELLISLSHSSRL